MSIELQQTLRRLSPFKNKNNEPPYMIIATDNGDRAAIETLYKNGYSIDSADSEGETPLVFAVRNNDVKTAELLLSYGADTNVQESQTIVFRRFGGRFDITETKTYTKSLIVLAAVDNHSLDMVKLLIEKGKIDPNSLNEEYFKQNSTQNIYNYIVNKQIEAQKQKEVQKVLNRLEKVSTQHPYMITAVNIADREAIQFLHKNGYNINIEDKNNETPLHHAVRNNDMQTVELLLSLGAQINGKQQTSAPQPKSVMEIAAGDNKNLDMVKLLVEKGKFNINNCDLDYFVKNSTPDIVRYIRNEKIKLRDLVLKQQHTH